MLMGAAQVPARQGEAAGGAPRHPREQRAAGRGVRGASDGRGALQIRLLGGDAREDQGGGVLRVPRPRVRLPERAHHEERCVQLRGAAAGDCERAAAGAGRGAGAGGGARRLAEHLRVGDAAGAGSPVLGAAGPAHPGRPRRRHGAEGDRPRLRLHAACAVGQAEDVPRRPPAAAAGAEDGRRALPERLQLKDCFPLPVALQEQHQRRH